MLQEVGKYNKIPQELREKLVYKSSSGEPGSKIARFKLIRQLTDPIADEGKPVKLYPATDSIPATSSFRHGNKWIDIGLFTSVDNNENYTINEEFRTLRRWEPFKTNGEIAIMLGASPVTDALYEYLMLASFVENNLIPDDMKKQSESIKLRFVDEEAEARKVIEAQELQWKAITEVTKLSPEQVDEVAQLLGFGKLAPTQKLAAVRSYAQKEPEKFLERLNDNTSPYKARISQAIAEDIVKIIPEKRTLNWNDSSNGEILKLAKPDDIDSIQNEYAEFALSDAGKKADQVILQALSKKKKTK